MRQYGWIKKVQGADTTYYFSPDFEVIDNTPVLYAFAGNLRIARITDSETTWFHKDHLGSTNALTLADQTIVETGEYLPFGTDRDDNDLVSNTSYKFTDQEQDHGTGLYNYDARLYDPVLGMFVMADTVVPDTYNSQSLNRYSYC